MLSAVATAFTIAGVSVHAVDAATHNGRVCDRFEVTDRNGQKLAPATEATIQVLLAAGSNGSRRRRPRRWTRPSNRPPGSPAHQTLGPCPPP